MSLKLHQIITVWSCAAITGYEAAIFDSRDLSSVSVCGFCGESFHRWSEADLTREKKHLDDVHRWDLCSREKQFYRPDIFRQHLKDNHRALPGWWSEKLERNARREIQRPHVTDTFSHSLSGRRGGSPSLRASLVSHHDDSAPGNAHVVRRSSSIASRTNSMRRVHSDVSEYDVQGNLMKRTIMDSYTSIVDAASPSLQRNHSSPGPQSHVAAHSPTNRDLYCFYCSDSREFHTRASLTKHLCTRHSDSFVRAQKHGKLKGAYKKQTTQLRRALKFLILDDVEHSSADEPQSSIRRDWITDTLKDLDLDSGRSSSEDSEDIGVKNKPPLRGRFSANRRCSDQDDGDP